MQIEKYQTQKQTQAVVRAFLRAHPGKEYDAMGAAIACREEWGIVIDWHEFSGALDILERAGEAVIVSPGGYTRYKMKETAAFRKNGPLFTILEGGAFFSSSDNPVIALMLYLYMAGYETDYFWRVLEELQDSTQFEIHVGETVYSYNDETREAFKQARREYDE